MFEAQYRTLGTGETAIYRKIFWKFGYIEEILENRMYSTEAQLNDCLLKMQGLFEKHSDQFDKVLEAKSKIKHDRQINPFNSAFFEMSKAKDSSKYRAQRGRPINLWESVRKAVLRAQPTQQMHECLYTDDDVTITMMSKSEQAVGAPVRSNNNQNMSKAERQRQHQQNQAQQAQNK